MTFRFAAAAALAALAACGHGATGSQAPASPAAHGVGYVRMDELIQKHPLYAQLARYDRSIEAFDLTAAAPRAVAADPQLRAREQELEKQLDAAANRTKKLLDDKQKQYQDQENRAIAAALQSSGSGPSAAQIASSVAATARSQQAGVAVQAQHDLDSYRLTLQKQDQAQIEAAQKALADRADRTYRAKLDELQSKESALSLRLANEDAAPRLALRTKLSSLALDDAARDDAQKQLAALDRKEADAVGAQRNQDQQTLAVLQAQLKRQVQSEIADQAAAVRRRSETLMAQRQGTLAKQVRTVAGGPLVQTTLVGGKPQQQVNPNLPPALRSRIQQLHQDYQKRFQDDAKTTIADFTKTRQDLSRRYAQLHDVDAAGQAGASAQIVSLRKKRADLYDQITAQIDREVRLIAQQRGVSVVLSDVVAPVDGIDLTPDALKDIESLHE